MFFSRHNVMMNVCVDNVCLYLLFKCTRSLLSVHAGMCIPAFVASMKQIHRSNWHMCPHAIAGQAAYAAYPHMQYPTYTHSLIQSLQHTLTDLPTQEFRIHYTRDMYHTCSSHYTYTLKCMHIAHTFTFSNKQQGPGLSDRSYNMSCKRAVPNLERK